jgi:hypothetical protein
MTDTERSDSARRSFRVSGTSHSFDLRAGLERMIFALAFGFAIALVFGLFA